MQRTAELRKIWLFLDEANSQSFLIPVVTIIWLVVRSKKALIYSLEFLLFAAVLFLPQKTVRMTFYGHSQIDLEKLHILRKVIVRIWCIILFIEYKGSM